MRAEVDTLNSSVEARQRLIVALDFPSAQQSLDFLDQLDGRAAWVKVGLELYLAAGPGVVETLTRAAGLHVFLDLKLHDIPNTVAGAVRSVKFLRCCTAHRACRRRPGDAGGCCGGCERYAGCS